MDGLGRSGDLVDERYVLRRVLGEGTYGHVWLAFDQRTQGEVALKLLRPHLIHRPRHMVRFEREANILAELMHPSIARALDYGSDPAQPYIAMEVIEGETLLAHLESTAPRGEMIPLSTVADWTGQIARALDYAHAIGVIHRDLKPSNIMITPDGLRILDFGVARLIFESEADRQTTVGRILGTLFYLSPEQASGAVAEQSSDIFSLGTVVFEMLTGRVAWAVDKNDEPLVVDAYAPVTPNSIVRVVERIRSGVRPKPSTYRSELSSEVDAVVLRALAVRVEERFNSAGAFAEALAEAIGSHVEANPTRTHAITPEPAQTGRSPAHVVTAVMRKRTAFPSNGTDRAVTKVPEHAQGATDTLVYDNAPAPQVTEAPFVRSAVPWLPISALALTFVMVGVLVGTATREGATGAALPPTPTPVVTVAPIPNAVAVPSATSAPPSVQAIEEPPATRAPTTPVPSSKRVRRTRITRPSPERHPLLGLIDDAAAHPEDAARISRVGRAFARLTDQLPPGPDRTALRRCATTAGIAADLVELERCARRLLQNKEVAR